MDPIKLNQTLGGFAEALTGLGDRFGRSLLDGDAILDDLNARMAQIRTDTGLLADLASVYADASPDLFDGLRDAAASAHTLTEQRADSTPRWRCRWASPTPEATSSSAPRPISYAARPIWCRPPSCSTDTAA